MAFGEKVRDHRKQLGMTQQELADRLGVSRRAVVAWEHDGKLPKRAEIYTELAALFSVPVEYLMSEDEKFLVDVSEEFGERGRKSAERLMEEVTGLFAGGELPEEDLDEFMLAIQTAYVDAKRKNKKFTPKKYRDD